MGTLDEIIGRSQILNHLLGPTMSANDFDKRITRMLHVMPKADARPWYKIQNVATVGKGADAKKSAEILIYDEIDPWFGVSSGDFANDLNELDADEITVGINSPGGIVFDGIAIMNALKRHPAKIITRIDGLAASAASFIAMAGDEIQTSKYAEMMIHEARGAIMGTAEDMAAMQDLLVRHNESIASVYADRAGGTVKSWLGMMNDETWFTADEMVKAGLADTILEAADESSAADEAESLKNRFDLTIFNYAGRRTAPAPTMSIRTRKGAATVATLKEQLAEKHGVDVELDDEAFAAALDEKLAESATTPGTPDPVPVEPSAELISAHLKNLGLATVDADTLEAMKAQAKQGSDAFAAIQSQSDARMVEDAIREGKIAPAARAKWLKNLAGPARDTFVDAIASLEAVFPVQEAGHSFNPEPDVMKAPDDLSWFDSAPLEPSSTEGK